MQAEDLLLSSLHIIMAGLCFPVTFNKGKQEGTSLHLNGRF